MRQGLSGSEFVHGAPPVTFRINPDLCKAADGKRLFDLLPHPQGAGECGPFEFQRSSVAFQTANATSGEPQFGKNVFRIAATLKEFFCQNSSTLAKVAPNLAFANHFSRKGTFMQIQMMKLSEDPA